MEDSKVWYLKQINIFDDLTDDSLAEIARLSVMKDYSDDQVIFTPFSDSQKIYLVKEGEVKVYEISPEGKKIVIDVLKPGSIFGDISATVELKNEPTHFARTGKQTKVCIISKRDFLQILQAKPDVALKVIQELSERLHQAESKIRDLALHDVELRLLNELIRLAKKHGQEDQKKFIVTEKMTHDELGHLIGASRETVTRALKGLSTKAFLEVGKDRNIVINKDKIDNTV